MEEDPRAATKLTKSNQCEAPGNQLSLVIIRCERAREQLPTWQLSPGSGAGKINYIYTSLSSTKHSSQSPVHGALLGLLRRQSRGFHKRSAMTIYCGFHNFLFSGEWSTGFQLQLSILHSVPLGISFPCNFLLSLETALYNQDIILSLSPSRHANCETADSGMKGNPEEYEQDRNHNPRVL